MTFEDLVHDSGFVFHTCRFKPLSFRGVGKDYRGKDECGLGLVKSFIGSIVGPDGNGSGGVVSPFPVGMEGGEWFALKENLRE